MLLCPPLKSCGKLKALYNHKRHFRREHTLVGKYEITGKKFSSLCKKASSGCLQSLCLKEVFPEYFLGSEKAPKIVTTLTKQVLDRHFDQENGAYNYDSSPEIMLLYKTLPESAARVKIDGLKSDLKTRLEQKLAKDNNGPVGTYSEPASRKVGESNADYTKIIREGLGQNPSDQELFFWADRVLQDLYSLPSSKPHPADLFALGDMAQSFHAIWSPESQYLIGSLVRPEISDKASGQAEKWRRNFANLMAAYIKILRSLKDESEIGLSVLELDVNMLFEDKLADLYIQILKRLHPETKKILAIDVKGIGKTPPPSTVQTHLSKVQSHIPFCMQEISLLSPHKTEIRGFDPKVYSFSASSKYLQPSKMADLIDKFVEQFTGSKPGLLAKNVKQAAELEILSRKKMKFISGPAISAPAVGHPFKKAMLTRDSLKV